MILVIKGLLRPRFRITLRAIMGLLGFTLALFWLERPLRGYEGLDFIRKDIIRAISKGFLQHF